MSDVLGESPLATLANDLNKIQESLHKLARTTFNDLVVYGRTGVSFRWGLYFRTDSGGWPTRDQAAPEEDG